MFQSHSNPCLISAQIQTDSLKLGCMKPLKLYIKLCVCVCKRFPEKRNSIFYCILKGVCSPMPTVTKVKNQRLKENIEFFFLKFDLTDF